MAELSDIDAARQEAVETINAVLKTAAAASIHPQLPDAISALEAKRTEIESLPVPAASEDARLDWTVETLRTAVDGMKAVGAGMVTSHRIVKDLDTFLGGGTIIVGAIRMMAAPRYRCPALGCKKSSITRSKCPVHKQDMVPSGGTV